MFRLGLIALCILGGGVLYAASVFMNDSRAVIEEAQKPVHGPSHDEIVVVSDPQPDDRKEIEAVLLPDEVEVVFKLSGEDDQGNFVAGSGDTFRAFVKRKDANVFLRSSLAYVEERRADALRHLDKRVAFAFDDAFLDKGASVDAYADWFFGWGNSFKVVFQAAKGAAAGLSTFDIDVILDRATVEMEEYMRTNYSALVLKPELRDPKIVQGIEAALVETHKDYLRTLRNIDDRLITFISDNARYVARIEPSELITVKLDWDAEAWKAPTHYAQDAFLQGMGTSVLFIAGQAAAPLLEQVALAALAPVVTETIATVEIMGVGAIAGSEIPLLGNVVGALAAVAIDKAWNMFREHMTRDDFVADTNAAETVRNSVRWRVDYAIGKRSSNMMASWLFTACHSRTERFHS